MKKLILTIALFFAFIGVNAQTQYDTIVYHPYDLSNYYIGGMDLAYHELRSLKCYGCSSGNLPGTNAPCWPFGFATGRNSYEVQGVAQPYHFDSTVTVIGIAVKVANGSLNPSLNGTVFSRIMDMEFKQLSLTPIFPWHTPDSDGYKRHMFFDEVPVKDFVLAGDIPQYSQTGFIIVYPCTWSLYDTVGCLENYLRSNRLPYDTMYVGIDYHAQNPFATVTDTLYASTFAESPWLLKDSVWVRFADDPVYNLYQKTFIEFLPILKVPRADSLSMVEEISNDNSIKLYPNPAENTLNIESQEIIKEIEFYDALGKEAKTITLNRKEATIDISSLAKGNYIVNLITDKGKITKKLVVK
ncbi:MAG: zinc metalloprotease [Bacteroidetes bacterium]|nr:zinc metalloprotease [Bacteroidota bacterium]